MSSPDEIKDLCHFDNARFGAAIKKLGNKYPDSRWNLVKELSLLVDIAKDPNKFQPTKSAAYLDYFMTENPTIDLRGGNPFYSTIFSASLPLILVYILIDECKANGILDVIVPTPPEDGKIVCALDLYDTESNYGLAVKKVNS